MLVVAEDTLAEGKAEHNPAASKKSSVGNHTAARPIEDEIAVAVVAAVDAGVPVADVVDAEEETPASH